jgi:hypothetical protein
MKTIKVSKATGPALDWLVAKCEERRGVKFGTGFSGEMLLLDEHEFGHRLSYSTDWAQGGPIIDREISKVFRNVGGAWSAMVLKDVPIPPDERGTSLALSRREQWNAAGPTPLIAAMRCYVTSKLGDTAEVPEELL